MGASTNKRIAKNSLLLYFRMLISMFIAFYATRLVLANLGSEQYGLSNVVASVVSIFTLLQWALSDAAFRFLNIELGKIEKGISENKNLRMIFSQVFFLFLFFSVLLFLLLETGGYWFMNYKVSVPAPLKNSVFVFYQFSIFTCLMTMFSMPFSSIVVAYECMDLYAGLTIADYVIKLIVAFLLGFGGTCDKLMLYGGLLFIGSVLHTAGYICICLWKFPVTKIECSFSWNVAKQIAGLFGWNIFGSLAGTTRSALIAVLLNNYTGALCNAAQAIAEQVSAAFSGLAKNYMIAVRPPVMKFWAVKNYGEFHLLVMRTSRLGFLFLFLLSIPALVETDFILSIWLKTVPSFCVEFVRLNILLVLVDAFSFPLMSASLATGKVALYQSIVGGVLLLQCPAAWILLYCKFDPTSVLWAGIVLAVFALFFRLLILKKTAFLPVYGFCKTVLFPAVLVCLLSLTVPVLLFSCMKSGWLRLACVCIVGWIWCIVMIAAFGMSSEERHGVFNLLQNRLQRKTV